MDDLFGLKEHTRQHELTERHIRTLYEEMATLALDVGALRRDLAEVAGQLDQ